MIEQSNPPTALDAPEQARALRRALEILLAEGGRYCEVPADPVTAADLRGWRDRLQAVTRQLADHLEAPARAKVIEVLGHDSLPDWMDGLYALRLEIAGVGVDRLGLEAGVSGRSIRRLEDEGEACYLSTAWPLATRFGLRVTELFNHHGSGHERFRPATVGQLRERLLDET